jgi:hypothetical protein
VVDRILGVPYQTCGEMMEEDPNMRSGFQYGPAYTHADLSKSKRYTGRQDKHQACNKKGLALNIIDPES